MSSVALRSTRSRYSKLSVITCVVLVWFHIQAVAAFWSLQLDEPVRRRCFLYWVVGRPRHQHGLPPAAHAPRIQDVQAVRVLPRRLRHADARRRADLLGRHASACTISIPTSPRIRTRRASAAFWAHMGWIMFGEAPHNDTARMARYAPDLGEGPVLPLADDLSLGAAHRARLRAARDRRLGARQLGDLPARRASACTRPGWSTRRRTCGAAAASPRRTTRATSGGSRS